MATLYVTTSGTLLGIREGRYQLKQNGQLIFEYPVASINRVVIMGRVQLTSGVINHLLGNQIETFFLTRSGKLKGILNAPESGNTSVRLSQYNKSSNAGFVNRVTGSIVRGKLDNCIKVARYLAGMRKIRIDSKIKQLVSLRKSIPKSCTAETLRGYEGSGARMYYAALASIIPKPFRFTGRNRRPPRDPVNVLLSLGYTLLTNTIFSAVRINSFDPYIGFLHTETHNNPALALDLVEEWRPVMDYWIVEALHRGEFSTEDFSEENEYVRLSREGLKRFFIMYESYLLEEVFHEEFCENTTVLRCMELQGRILRYCIEGKLDNYKPFKIILK